MLTKNMSIDLMNRYQKEGESIDRLNEKNRIIYCIFVVNAIADASSSKVEDEETYFFVAR